MKFSIDNNGDVEYGPNGTAYIHSLIVDGNLSKAVRVTDLQKARKLHGRLTFQGLLISIENRKGSYRSGVDTDGKPWRSKLHSPYGYIRNVMRGFDGDNLDCFIGPNKQSDTVFIVHQKDVKTGKFDEDKCMLGWNTSKQALAAYLINYNRSDQVIGVTAMPMATFKKKIAGTRKKPMMIKSRVSR